MLRDANVRALLAGVALVAGLVAVGSSCNQSILTAPPGSTLNLYANPKSIAAFGGVSVITAVVYDATGQPVPDGTVVQFFTDLGRVDEQGLTNDGVARVNLVADGRSGKATVTGVIGGGAAPAPAPTATPTKAADLGGSGLLSTTSSSASTARLTSVAENPVTVTIGSFNPTAIVLGADPPNISRNAPRYSNLTATVFDIDGNPISNIPVVFRISAPGDFTESLESGGQPVFSNNSGQAHDRIFTSVPRDGDKTTVKVKAVVVKGSAPIESNEVTIGINY